MADAAGSAGGDDVARIQGDDGGDIGHQIAGVEDEVIDSGALELLAGDGGDHLRAGGKLVGSDEHGPEQRRTFPCLALQPLRRRYW